MDERSGGDDVALFIDWENLKFSLLQRDRRPNVTALREAAERFGRIVYARAYADWQDSIHAGDPQNLYMAGLEPVYVLTKRYSEGGEIRLKNSVDVKLAADCIEASHVFPNIHTYVIVSGDHGFIHVANTLRLRGKQVVVIGVSWTTAAQLTQQADVVLYYDIDVERERELADDMPRTAPLRPAAKPAATPPAKKVAPAIAQLVEPAVERLKADGITTPDRGKVAEILDLILVIATEFRGARRDLSVSLVGQELQKRMGGGFAQHGRGRALPLTQVLAAAGQLKLVSQGFQDWIFLPGEPEELIHAQLPPVYQPVRYSISGLMFSDLTRDQQDDVVVAIHDARHAPGVDFLTFNRTRDAVASVVKRDETSLANLINNMVDSGILRIEGERTGRSPDGVSYTHKTFALDLKDSTVRRALKLP